MNQYEGLLPERSAKEAPSVTYRVVWIDNEKDPPEQNVFGEGLSSAEADEKVFVAKSHGFHAYKDAEGSSSSVTKKGALA